MLLQTWFHAYGQKAAKGLVLKGSAGLHSFQSNNMQSKEKLSVLLGRFFIRI